MVLDFSTNERNTYGVDVGGAVPPPLTLQAGVGPRWMDFSILLLAARPFRTRQQAFQDALTQLGSEVDDEATKWVLMARAKC